MQSRASRLKCGTVTPRATPDQRAANFIQAVNNEAMARESASAGKSAPEGAATDRTRFGDIVALVGELSLAVALGDCETMHAGAVEVAAAAMLLGMHSSKGDD